MLWECVDYSVGENTNWSGWGLWARIWVRACFQWLGWDIWAAEQFAGISLSDRIFAGMFSLDWGKFLEHDVGMLNGRLVA